MVSVRDYARRWGAYAAFGIALAIPPASAFAKPDTQPPNAEGHAPQPVAHDYTAFWARETPKAAPHRPDCKSPEDAEELSACAEAQSARAGWLQVIGLLATFVVTGWAARSAAKAASAAVEATKVIPKLERPYVYSEMVSDDTQHGLQVIVAPHRIGIAQVSMTIRLKNYGKTPARLLHGEIELTTRDRSLGQVHETTEWPIKGIHVLGEGDSGEDLTYALAEPVTVREADAILRGVDQLFLMGFVVYLDPWDERQSQWIGWTYNPTLGRMTPDEHRDALESGADKPLPSALTGYIAAFSEFLRKG